MGALDNLNSPVVREIFQRLRALETAPAATNTAIGRSGLLVYDGGVITIENGGLDVTGTATISGTFNGSGTNNLDGINNLSGENHLTGPTDVAGDLELIAGGLFKAGASEIRPDGSAKFGLFDIDANGDLSSKGKLSIEDVATLKADLNVTTGKIVAGSVTIDPGYLSGSIKFANGSSLASTPNGAQLVNGSGAVTVSSSQADLGVIGRSLIINGVGTYLTGLPTTSNPANLYVDPSNDRIYRSTA